MNEPKPTPRVVERDPDFRHVEEALILAAAEARALGERTKTPVYVLRDKRIIDLLTGAEYIPPPPSE